MLRAGRPARFLYVAAADETGRRRRLDNGRMGSASPRAAAESAQRALLNTLLAEHGIHDFVLWYYTQMALGFTRHLLPRATVYEVMDELSLFRLAPPRLLEREEELYQRAARPENADLYRRYKLLADATDGVHFVGRLATYKYYNMDQVVGQALSTYARIRGTKRPGAYGSRALAMATGTARAGD
ncbi:MAG: hypothetical protein KY464_07680 [Gemmatimonadetes bacterium]|nr:hypothetical protein [Gemmatimonadota bacterium]